MCGQNNTVLISVDSVLKQLFPPSRMLSTPMLLQDLPLKPTVCARTIPRCVQNITVQEIYAMNLMWHGHKQTVQHIVAIVPELYNMSQSQWQTRIVRTKYQIVITTGNMPVRDLIQNGRNIIVLGIADFVVVKYKVLQAVLTKLLIVTSLLVKHARNMPIGPGEIAPNFAVFVTLLLFPTT